jgi:hypothetical protein
MGFVSQVAGDDKFSDKEGHSGKLLWQGLISPLPRLFFY